MGTTYTTEGEELVVDLIDHSTSVTGWYISWGSGTVTDGKSSTGLENEATEVRVTATTEDQSTTQTNRWIGIHTCGAATKTISEAGLHTAATDGSMPIIGTFTGIGLATDDQIQFTITLEQT